MQFAAIRILSTSTFILELMLRLVWTMEFFMFTIFEIS